MTGQLIAIDWGTTNRRAYLLDEDGNVVTTERDGRGLLAIEAGGFAGEVAEIRAKLGDWPVLLAGMVGSAKGWVNVPYLACPAGLDDLAGALHWVEAGRTAIVPGLSYSQGVQGDVMRGEEVQLLGATAAGLVPADSLLCQPGTHCKWARMEGGRVASFATAMTGEIFALLKSHSLLSDFLTGAVEDGAAFRAGVADGLSGRLTSLLFGVRASALLGLRSAQDSAAYTSGLLIGHDVAGEQLAAGQPAYILSDRHLGALYSAAVEMAGGTAHLVDSHAAFVAGISHIWKAYQS
ncbi:2-dehydro-3-deoxygalactonokinase [Novosphingobium umbonatum]|uniref:2-dehydro-3-deoxygalactonokinase n=1 Tax=Novosphingobium umbonatum TaxID=1908524 RepID=A0A3S3TSW7_9SPHN|nr:2-dehydro-3-deoxygalactonokinase [Novosphingobium umbonatum]RVU07758.1 2-dehydro-3-deoxygalactonokinase [Novosphingobium umbonatum]